MQEESIDEESKVYLIVVFGPPASGKSTFARNLKGCFVDSELLTENGCMIVSADCFEQYLRGHSVEQLECLLKAPNGWQTLNSYNLKRSAFNQQIWKQSRDFIKKNIVYWLKKWKVLILQDDLLLKSQRKQVRQQVEHSDVRYLEIMMTTSLEACLQNCKKRNQAKLQEEKLSVEVLRECFSKFEPESGQYCLAWHSQDALSWNLVRANAKKVVIEHPEKKQKEAVSQQNEAMDLAQAKIRKFISEIMASQEVREKYFKGKNPKQVGALLSKLKKNYKDKSKSVEGFRAYLQHQTSKML